MRGRHPYGTEYVELLDGSPQAKMRLRVVLETMTGKYRVQEACRLLDITEQRFEQIRKGLLQAALENVETKPAGRPRRPAPVAEVRELEAKVAELERELQAAQVRAELALVLPNAFQEEGAEKKTPRKCEVR